MAAAKTIRHFNRYYTNKLGLLARYRFDTKLTLTEARVLFEIGRRGAHIQAALGAELKIDGGYLNRVVAKLAERGFLVRRKGELDGRLVVLELSPAGRDIAESVDAASDEEAAELIAGLEASEAGELVEHMRGIELILERRAKAKPRIEPVESSLALASVRILMREYVEFLGEDLGFQDIEKELEALPGKYAPPKGAIFIARLSLTAGDENASAEGAGCVALRPLESGICEMKRLFVRPEYRGFGIGRALAERIIEAAEGIGYERMRLDTLERLGEAVSLYEKLGFERIPPYCENPLPGAMFWEKRLA